MNESQENFKFSEGKCNLKPITSKKSVNFGNIMIFEKNKEDNSISKSNFSEKNITNFANTPKEETHICALEQEMLKKRNIFSPQYLKFTENKQFYPIERDRCKNHRKKDEEKNSISQKKESNGKINDSHKFVYDNQTVSSDLEESGDINDDEKNQINLGIRGKLKLLQTSLDYDISKYDTNWTNKSTMNNTIYQNAISVNKLTNMINFCSNLKYDKKNNNIIEPESTIDNTLTSNTTGNILLNALLYIFVAKMVVFLTKQLFIWLI